MSSHYVSLNRGQEGTSHSSDYVTGTSSTARATFEFRVLDGAGATKMDVIKSLESFRRFFESAPLVSTAGFSVSG